MNEGYVVIDINPAKNRVNGGFMFRIRLLEITTRRLLLTYIDPANRNYDRWAYIIRDFKHGQLLANLKKITRGKREFIDADSTPVRIYCGPRGELERVLKEYWEPAPTTFKELFEEIQ